MDLRCRAKKFGELTDDGVIEIKCSSKFCGEPGTVVIHRFDPLTGKLIETKRFRDPVPVVNEEVQDNGSRHDSASVWSPSS
jgi:hypothetical protein